MISTRGCPRARATGRHRPRHRQGRLAERETYSTVDIQGGLIVDRTAWREGPPGPKQGAKARPVSDGPI
jgi:hypothetical protein